MTRYSFSLKLFASKLLFTRIHDCRFLSTMFSQIPAHECKLILRNKSVSCKFSFRSLRFGVKKLESPRSSNARRILKVAIVGVPNAGKSTLINQIVGRNVFSVSSKVHTTRCRARAVMVVENTQLVFLDTPGVVNIQESIKHHLERPCVVDSEEAIKEADIVGVVHDVSNKYTIFKLDTKILRTLFLYPTKPSFLILNKVDVMKSKRELLDCVNHLTKGHGVLEEPDNVVFSKVFRLNEEGESQLTENDLQNLLLDQTGWPYFKKVFMISALNGNGVGDIQMYLMEEAKPGEWLFEEGVLTDQSEMDVIEKTVFAKLLDHLPNIVPYNIGIQLDYFDRNVDGSVNVVVLLYVKKAKLMHLIKGQGGGRIKRIAFDVEQNLRSFYLNDVHVRLVIIQKKDITVKKPKFAGTTDVFCSK